MKKYLPLIALCCFVCSFAIIPVLNNSALADEEQAEVTEVLTWDNPKWTLTFQHAKHTKYENVKCTSCHHKTEEGKTPKKCSECHPPKKSGPEDKSITYKRSMHKQCKDCHKKSQKGPYKKCGECHIKKVTTAE